MHVKKGFTVNAGYKQFFGSSKKFGLRYNVFFEYGHAATNKMDPVLGGYSTNNKNSGYDMYNYITHGYVWNF